jgi:hypothetical protein
LFKESSIITLFQEGIPQIEKAKKLKINQSPISKFIKNTVEQRSANPYLQLFFCPLDFEKNSANAFRN